MEIKQEIKNVKITKVGNKYFLERTIIQELTGQEFKQFSSNTEGEVLLWENIMIKKRAEAELVPKIEKRLITKVEEEVKVIKYAEKMLAVEKAKEELSNAKINYDIHSKYNEAIKKYKGIKKK